MLSPVRDGAWLGLRRWDVPAWRVKGDTGPRSCSSSGTSGKTLGPRESDKGRWWRRGRGSTSSLALLKIEAGRVEGEYSIRGEVGALPMNCVSRDESARLHQAADGDRDAAWNAPT